MAFSHIGLYVTDMESTVTFYTGVLGFSVTDRVRIRGRDVVFLSRSPEEHHQIVLVPGRAPHSPSTVNQISFRVISLAESRRLHGTLAGLRVPCLDPTNHGGSWSVYFSDPEGTTRAPSSGGLRHPTKQLLAEAQRGFPESTRRIQR